MRINSYQSVVSVLLAAVLVVDGVGLHGFGHAHLGGDQDHSHEDGATAEHDECTCHHCHGDHHHSQHQAESSLACEAELTAGLVEHAHLSIFGFEFSVPISDESQGKHPSQSLSFICLRDDCVVVPVVRPVHSDLLLQALLTTEDSQTAEMDLAAPAKAQVPSPPLCDSARFERSGVLLV